VHAGYRVPGAPRWPTLDLLAGAREWRPLRPAAAVTRDGEGVAAWLATPDQESAIHASTYVPGRGWAAPVPLSAGFLRGADPIVRAAADSSGGAVVVWSGAERVGCASYR
jgi:hypothetical protein